MTRDYFLPRKILYLYLSHIWIYFCGRGAFELRHPCMDMAVDVAVAIAAAVTDPAGQQGKEKRQIVIHMSPFFVIMTTKNLRKQEKTFNRTASTLAKGYTCY